MKRALLFFLLCAPSARAEVPPVIVGVREAMRDARRVLDRRPVATAHASGGECVALPEAEPGDDIPERVEVERQIAACSRQPGRKADVWGLLALWRLEEQLGVPVEARGILGAVYCVESAMRTVRWDGSPIRGDVRAGVAMAHGPYQLWPWHRAWCGLTASGADDLEGAARCFWARVVDRREVRALGCPDSWRVGEALTANGPRYLPLGCAAKSAHWSAMEAAR